MYLIFGGLVTLFIAWLVARACFRVAFLRPGATVRSSLRQASLAAGLVVIISAGGAYLLFR